MDDRSRGTPATAPSPAEAATAHAGLWAAILTLGGQIRADDWSRPTPCPGMDVGDLVTHVAGPYLPARPRHDVSARLDGVRAASTAAVDGFERATRATTAADPHLSRMLGLACLDLWVHHADLAEGLGVGADFDDESVGVLAATAAVARFVPHLMEQQLDLADGTDLDLHVGAALDTRLSRRDGQTVRRAGTGTTRATITATPAAFVLLLSGRGDPADWRDRGVMEWSGALADAFVHGVRLPG